MARSRLNTYEQKQFQRKMILYVVLFIGMIYLMMTVGIRFLVNASFFISGITNKKSNQASQKNSFYGSAGINSIPTATNSAKIVVIGQITNYDKIEFYINERMVKDSIFPTSDSFTQEIGDLKLGNNDVYIKATSKDSTETKESTHYTVLYKNDKPKLNISEPTDGTKTSKDEIKLAGNTTSEIFIKVNELPLVVTADGSFQTSVRLKDGDNTIVVTAEDNAGNKESRTIKVTRENP